MITSSHNPKIQQVRRLMTQRHEREEAGAFAVEGVRLLGEAILGGWIIKTVLFCEGLSGRGHELVKTCSTMDAEVEEITSELMSAVADTESPQGIMAVVGKQELPLPEKPDFILIADGVRDPGNLGTLLRTAAAAGVQAVLLAPGTVDAFSPKVVRAGMGAHFRVPMREMTWETTTAWLKTGAVPRPTVYLADSAGGIPCWQVDLKNPLALIIGGEADGACQAARDLADGLLTIPMPGESESLNAAIAAGIMLFEVVRQRSVR